ncbi:methylmalonyl-CoA mutase subunit beta [Sporichthya polymorpha]|uniref:methylmalonyl-CoA mutase subunit beta n=1 Tax=Sporichthya polymorpha TaxID=35751 RepID=UPI0003722F29|nr:methylmalonyl-CoA mutase subunit beta [Sporichthya polymorpha]
MPDDLVLAAEFPSATMEDWRALVSKIVARSGAEFPADAPEQALASTTRDGIEISPLYVPDPNAELGLPGQAPYLRGRTAEGLRTGWDIVARQTSPDPKTANEQALEDLAGGATSLWLTLGEGGLPVADLPQVLDEVMLDVAGVHLDAGTEYQAAAQAFLDLAMERRHPFEVLTGTLGFDPIGLIARTGDAEHFSMPEQEAVSAQGLKTAYAYRNMRTVTVDALIYHEAGATDAQELGIALATGAEYLRSFTEVGGMPTGIAFSQIDFRLGVTVDQFATIAKLRAGRRCWSRVAELSRLDAPTAGMRQHAVTSWPMMTRKDPWTNMLRTTVATFAAAVAGADSITVLPFDAALGLPDTLARRVARNIPHLLIEESHVAAVVDPAGGSGYVEALSERLAQEAWKVFTEIEAAGGILAVLADGSLAERVAAAREQRLAAVAAGEETVLGVNAFPLEGEQLLERAPAPVRPAGDAFPRIRWSEALENATLEAPDGGR